MRTMFDDAELWRSLLGPFASDADVSRAMQVWRGLLWSWQRSWLHCAVERIEINEADSTLSVTLGAA